MTEQNTNEAPEVVDNQPTPPEPSDTTMDAVDRAFATLEEMDGIKFGDDDDDETGPVRDQTTGKFQSRDPEKAAAAAAAREEKRAQEAAGDDEELDEETGEEETQETPTRFAEAPARFSEDAKKAWAGAPEPVRAEIHRAVRELEAGVEKYRGDAEKYDSVRDFDALAQQHGTTMRQAMTNYTNLERTLTQDPIRGLQEVCAYVGLSLPQVVAQLSGQEVNGQLHEASMAVNALRQQLADVVRERDELLGHFNQTTADQEEQQLAQALEQFAAEPGHERFDELSEQIVVELGYGYSLAEAYRRAEMLNPGSEPVSPPPPPAAQTRISDPKAQTQKGSLSVTGSPGASGSNPRTKASKTPEDAADKAMKAVGL